MVRKCVHSGLRQVGVKQTKAHTADSVNIYHEVSVYSLV